MNVEEIIMNIKCAVAAAEYHLAVGNRPNAEANLRHIPTLFKNMQPKPDPNSKDKD